MAGQHQAAAMSSSRDAVSRAFSWPMGLTTSRIRLRVVSTAALTSKLDGSVWGGVILDVARASGLASFREVCTRRKRRRERIHACFALCFVTPTLISFAQHHTGTVSHRTDERAWQSMERGSKASTPLCHAMPDARGSSALSGSV